MHVRSVAAGLVAEEVTLLATLIALADSSEATVVRDDCADSLAVGSCVGSPELASTAVLRASCVFDGRGSELAGLGEAAAGS